MSEEVDRFYLLNDVQILYAREKKIQSGKKKKHNLDLFFGNFPGTLFFMPAETQLLCCSLQNFSCDLCFGFCFVRQTLNTSSL